MTDPRLLEEETAPSAAELKNAFKVHGVDMKYYKGWENAGRDWDSSGGGLYGVVVHHTSTPSAVDGNGAPTLYWAVSAYAPYTVANQLVGKDPGSNWCLSAGGTYHSGLGGPWNAVGLPSPGNTLHWRAWGIEIDDPGRSNTINKYQVEQVARTIAALWDLCKWPDDGSTIITHGDWTDSGPYLGEKNYGPYRYRKNDTLRQYYDQDFWRKEAKKYRIPETFWDETIPKRRAAMKSAQEDIRGKASYRVAARLFDLGKTKREPRQVGTQKYPTNAVKKFQREIGLEGEKANGLPNKETWIALFDKDKP